MKKKKITDSERLASIERYLYGQDLDGNIVSAGHQRGWSLRERLQESLSGVRYRHNTYTLKSLSKDLDRITKDLKNIKDVQTSIFIAVIGIPIAVGIGVGLSYFP